MSGRWARMLDEVTRQRDEIGRVDAVLATVTARAVSADRLIAVTVDIRGSLTDLTIEPGALRRYRADQLSAAITALVTEADREIRAKRNEILTAAVQPSPDYTDVR